MIQTQILEPDSVRHSKSFLTYQYFLPLDVSDMLLNIANSSSNQIQIADIMHYQNYGGLLELRVICENSSKKLYTICIRTHI